MGKRVAEEAVIEPGWLAALRPRRPTLNFDRLIGLGGRCETAYQLRHYARSERAYPFDWWITPLHALPVLLREGADGAFAPQHLHKLADYDGKPALYSHFAGAVERAGTVHLHEFGHGEDWSGLSTADISARLVPKYAALRRRMAEDAAAGRILFVRQRLPGHDPEDPEALEALVGEVLRELERLSGDFMLLLLDFCPLPPRPGLLQSRIPPIRGIEGLGSRRGWWLMFRSLAIRPGRGPRPRLPDIFRTLPP